MKISKVDHRKTAVGVIKKQGTRGIIYQDPIREQTNMENIVRKRTGSTKILFNIFDEGALKTDVSKDAKDLAKQVNAGIKSLKENKRNNHKEEINNTLTTKRLVEALRRANTKGMSFSENTIDEALNTLLKKSMRVKATKDVLKVLLLAIYDNKFNEKLSKDEEKNIKDNFIHKLVLDYSKSAITKNTPKSLKNQNMVIQPGSEDQILLPAQNPYSSKRKQSEKEALRNFMLQYAVIDDSTRHDIRIRLRRLVDLYFYSEDKVIKEDFNEWEIHDLRKSESELFAPIYKKKSVDKNGKVHVYIDVDETRDSFRTHNIECFRASKLVIANNEKIYFADTSMNDFWIHHIEGEVERIYSLFGDKTEDFKFTNGYLSEKVWKGIINYLSIKYIAIGKAVYNYALNDISNSSGNIKLGTIDDKYIYGISSFEYERIKAEETLQREVAVNVAFAANHLANATVNLMDKSSDMLLFSLNDLKKNMKDSALRNILQFFGGKSSWDKFDFGFYVNDNYTEVDFLNDIKNMIYSLRNSSFHFKTENVDNDSWNKNLIGAMFEYDNKQAGIVVKNKFYSNNLPLFYSEAALNKVLHILYDNYSERASQVPAFNSILARKNFPDFLKEHKINDPAAFTVDEKIMWHNSLYYLYKEIYYNAFLQDADSFDIFKKYINNLRVDLKDNKGKITNEANANKNFKAALAHYKSDNLFQICQMIMTEYNQQNAGGRKKKSAYALKKNPEIFKHYKMILYKALRESLAEYIDKNNEKYGFIKNPTKKNELPALDVFLPQYISGQYSELVSNVKKSPELQKWYIMARFLNPKQTNQLIGSFRSYVQYVNDIARRAKETGNKLSNNNISIDIDNIIKIMDICTKLNGITSNHLEDYFDNKDEYAKYISYFVKYGLKENDEFASAKLGEFCEREVDGKKIGIYHDGTNPILNKNIIWCKLYGASDILKESIEKVDELTIKQLFGREEGIKAYQEKGKCKNKKEQIELKKYQELKNKIELRDFVEYSEIINELQGQLINWSYLRERDLMYFQLGFHYLCLTNNTADPKHYRTIIYDDKKINGAILYQIAAIMMIMGN